jgi:hypothetical protein
MFRACLSTYAPEETLMNLTPPPSTPVVKRSRAKTPVATAESKKPTLTTKSRSRKKPAAEPVMEAPAAEASVSYTSDQLRSMIATAAYYRAVDRHFAPGNEMEDWLVAEQQVMASLG